jgi:hypothetical protein
MFFVNELSVGTPPVLAVIESSCGHEFTFNINGHNASMVSKDEDYHDSAYDNVYISAPFAQISHDTCSYTLTVYPTAEYEVDYTTNNPVYYMLVVLAIFLLTCISFLVFDCLVQRRQRSLVTTARKQNALVSSLFPKSIQKVRSEFHLLICTHGIFCGPKAF